MGAKAEPIQMWANKTILLAYTEEIVDRWGQNYSKGTTCGPLLKDFEGRRGPWKRMSMRNNYKSWFPNSGSVLSVTKSSWKGLK